MSNRDTRVFGQKYACPGCHSLLKFRQPPKSALHTCPHCRRILKLQERKAAASEDDLLKEALDSLLSWNPEDKPVYEYARDPRLDELDDSRPGLWTFRQPWPEHVHQVVMERTKVAIDPSDPSGCLQHRRCLLKGYHRRVTVYRTGEVEEIAVTGHWWERRDQMHHECRLGILPRKVVRELNRIPSTPVFAARINCLQKSELQGYPVLDLFIDLAVDETPVKKLRLRRIK
jgi:hypothetical protein